MKDPISHDPRIIAAAAKNKEFWDAAAAFGDGPAAGNTRVTWLDAFLWLMAQTPKQDGRRKYQHQKNDLTLTCETTTLLPAAHAAGDAYTVATGTQDVL